MPNNRTVSINQIPTNEWGFVRGRVDWSRVASLIDGAELENEIARARSFGRQFMQQRPYTRMSVYDAQIVDYRGNPKAESEFSTMDRYLSESMFQKRNRSGWCFEARNTSSILPEVGLYNLDTSTIDIVHLQQGEELSQGSDVILGIRCYAPRTKGYNKGISLREVWAIGKLEIRQPGGPNGIDSYLSSLGITINRDDNAVVPTVASGSVEPAPATEVPVNPVNPVVQAQPMPQMPQMPVQQPYSTQQMPAPVPPMPTAPMTQPYSYSPQGVDPAMQRPTYQPTNIGLNAPVSDDEPF